MLLLNSNTTFSHESSSGFESSFIFPISQLSFFSYGILIFFSLILIIILFHKKINELVKKIIYCLVVITASFVTIYLILTTLIINSISETKGPVHWHADFKIWVCGSELDLVSSKGVSNKIGKSLLHEHDDNRIHIEGVVLRKIDVNLGAFFNSIGGSLNNDELNVPTDNGNVIVKNGNKCNGKDGKIYVFVNGYQINDPINYVISPYQKVPPGDKIKIIFTEESLEKINPKIE